MTSLDRWGCRGGASGEWVGRHDGAGVGVGERPAAGRAHRLYLGVGEAQRWGSGGERVGGHDGAGLARR